MCTNVNCPDTACRLTRLVETHLPLVPFAPMARSDVDLDGRDDLLVFTEKGSYYMISNGDNFNDPVSTALWSNQQTSSVGVPDVKTLGMTDETAATVVASSSVIRDAPLEQRCGVPYNIVAYYSSRRRDSSSACVQVGAAPSARASAGHRALVHTHRAVHVALCSGRREGCGGGLRCVHPVCRRAA